MAPDQEKAVKLWAAGAKDALDTAEKLFDSKKYHHALFFCHLSVEKALKARYIREHAAIAPYTHDLAYLASKIGLEFSRQQLAEFAELSTFNLEARYEEAKLDLKRKATSGYTEDWLRRVALILKSLV